MEVRARRLKYIVCCFVARFFLNKERYTVSTYSKFMLHLIFLLRYKQIYKVK